MDKNQTMSKEILDNIGGKGNIGYLVHCVTRLRFTFKDRSLVNEEAVKKIKGVMGIMEQNGQFQIIVGQEVPEIYNEICKMANFEKEDQIDENLDAHVGTPKGKFSIKNIFNVLSESFAPIVPALAGAGVLKGILILLTTYAGLSNKTGIYTLINAVGDSVFYFLPFLLAVFSARHFKTNVTLALVVAGIYLHPTINALANKSLDILGITVPVMSYSSTVVPILLSVWVLSYVHKFFEKHIHRHLRVVCVPLFSLIVVAPISIMVFGPIGVLLGTFLGNMFMWIFTFSPILGGLVSGTIRSFVVLTGSHMMFVPIKLANYANYGYDFLTPVDATSTMAVAGMCFGAFLKSKNFDNKSSFFSAFVSGVVGITEPGLYGLAFKFKKSLYALMIGGGVAGAVVAGLGSKSISYGMPSIVSLPIFAGSIPQVLFGLAIAFFLTAALTYAFGFGEEA